MFAAAISTLVAFTSMSIYRLHDINKRYFKIKIDKDLILKSIIILLIIIPCYYSNKVMLKIISLIVSVIYAWDINKASISTVLNIFKNKLKTIKNV